MATKDVIATSAIRTLVAKHFGVSLGRVTDEMNFTQDLGADWLDRLALMMAVEEQFAGLEITDNDVDRTQVVGDLIHHIEMADNKRRRQGAAPVIRKVFEPDLARAVRPTKHQKGCAELALFFLRLGGDAMRGLIGWCPETRQPIDLQFYVDDTTLTRIWSNAVRFRCPHCGVKHETKVERLASRPLSLEPRETRCPTDRHAARLLVPVS